MPAHPRTPSSRTPGDSRAHPLPVDRAGDRASLGLWMGAECSVVRVRDHWIDQAAMTGYEARASDDIARMAALGATALRIPVLWERTWPEPNGAPDWSFADAQLLRARELGVRPIVGLVHHGSGPRHTSLLDPAFATGLGRFARQVAERYPWVEDYTPVNEPLTTARFSALYGHWYPHLRDSAAFLRALLVQCAAVREAMAAVREVTPAARLVQTEDLGTIFSTPGLDYQARFENERRFLSLDLLCGRVDLLSREMRRHLRRFGVSNEALRGWAEAPCPPDIIGLNHYVTSDRFLDGEVARYPRHARGGNGRDTYADVEAVRVLGAGLPGHAALLGSLWQRYRRPLAITEAHIGCHPEEQVRWLREAWLGAEAARADGVDVRAVTAWSVFGACDWDSLLTQQRGHYEPGLFDVRGGHVRPTALAHVAADLAAIGDSAHPMATEPGWWRRGVRLQYPSHGPIAQPRRPSTRRPLLVTGANGTLGRALARACERRSLRTVLLDRRALDIADAGAVEAALEVHQPWAVVNAAGYVRVDDAEGDRIACMRANATGPALLAEACARRGTRLAVFSSDLVFDGAKAAPYVESDPVAPLGVYGESKARVERAVRERCPDALVARTSAFFGPWDQANFLWAAFTALREGREFRAAGDMVVSPTYVPDLADAILTLLVDGGSGVWHLANAGAVSWHGFACRAAELAGVDTAGLLECSTESLRLAATRPAGSALASERGGLMPPLDDAIERLVLQAPALFERVGVRRRA